MGAERGPSREAAEEIARAVDAWDCSTFAAKYALEVERELGRDVNYESINIATAFDAGREAAMARTKEYARFLVHGCSQCGKPFREPACGPTHTALWAELMVVAAQDRGTEE